MAVAIPRSIPRLYAAPMNRPQTTIVATRMSDLRGVRTVALRYAQACLAPQRRDPAIEPFASRISVAKQIHARAKRCVRDLAEDKLDKVAVEALPLDEMLIGPGVALAAEHTAGLGRAKAGV